MPEMDPEIIRATMLQSLKEIAANRSAHSVNAQEVLKAAATKLNIYAGHPSERVFVTVWHDFYREGLISWGNSLQTLDLPFFHLSERGRKTLENVSRDPANPEGYWAYLCSQLNLNAVAQSYLKEALNTYNSNCFKATAVMVGAASESIALELRDALVAKLTGLGKTPPPQMEGWRIKVVLDSLKTELDLHKRKMPRSLMESYEANWTAFTWQIRTVRNEAGHPSSVDPVTAETVHASLLIFPSLAKLTYDLIEWVSNNLT